MEPTKCLGNDDLQINSKLHTTAALAKARETRVKANMSYCGSINMLESRYSTATVELEANLQQLNQKHTEELQKVKDSHVKEFQEKVAEWKNEYSSKRQELVQVLESELERTRCERERLRMCVQNLQYESSRKEDRIRDLSDVIVTLKDSLNSAFNNSLDNSADGSFLQDERNALIQLKAEVTAREELLVQRKNEHSNLESKLEAANAVVSENDSKIAKLSSELKRVKIVKDKVSLELHEEQEYRKEHAGQSQELVKGIKSSQQKKQLDLQNEVKMQQQMISSRVQKLDEQMELIKVLRDENLQLISQLERIAASAKGGESSVKANKSFGAEISDFMGRLDESRQSREFTLAELNECYAQRDRLAASYDDQLCELQAELEFLKNEYASKGQEVVQVLESELERTRCDRERLGMRVENLQYESTGKEDRIRDLSDVVDRLEESLRNLEKQRSETQQLLAQNQMLDRQEGAVQILQEQLEKVQESKESIQESLYNEKQKLKEALSKLSESEKNLTMTKLDLKFASKEKKDAEQALEVAKTEKAEVLQTLQTLESEKSEISVQLRQAEKCVESLKLNMEISERSLSEITKLFEDLKADFSAQAINYEKLDAELGACKSKLEDYESLRLNFAQRESEMRQKEAELEEKDCKISSLTAVDFYFFHDYLLKEVNTENVEVLKEVITVMEDQLKDLDKIVANNNDETSTFIKTKANLEEQKTIQNKKRRSVKQEERKRLDMLYPEEGVWDYNVGPSLPLAPIPSYEITYSEHYDEPVLSLLIPRKDIAVPIPCSSQNVGLINADSSLAKRKLPREGTKGPTKLDFQERKQRAFYMYGKAQRRPQEEIKNFLQFRRKINYTMDDIPSRSSEVLPCHWSNEFLHPNKPLNTTEATLKLVNGKVAFDSMMLELWDEIVIGLDLEAHEDRSFFGMTALIQVSTSSTDFLINPFGISDELSHDFKNYLQDTEGLVVMHGCTNDLLWLLSDFRIKVGTVFDVQDYYYVDTGRFQAGLKEVAQYYTGKSIDSNGKDICQVADWTKQPLHKDLVEYARQDSRQLLEIFEAIKFKDPYGILVPTALYETRRRMKAQYTPKAYPDCEQQLKALRKRPVLSSNSDALLHVLWEWRKIIAWEFDDGPEYVIPFRKLVEMSVRPPSSIDEINSVLHPMSDSTSRSITSLMRVIQLGRPYLERMKKIPCHICKKIGHVAEICYRRGTQKDVKDWMKSHPEHKTRQNRRRRINKTANERKAKRSSVIKSCPTTN